MRERGESLHTVDGARGSRRFFDAGAVRLHPSLATEAARGSQASMTVALRGELRHDEPMSRHVSWRAGGHVDRAYFPVDLEDLQAFLGTVPSHEPLYFVGLGSNLLVRDGGLRGTVVFTHWALRNLGSCTSMKRKAWSGPKQGLRVPSSRALPRFTGSGPRNSWRAFQAL